MTSGVFFSNAVLCKIKGCDSAYVQTAVAVGEGWAGVMYEYFIGTLALYQMLKCKLSKTGPTSLTLLSMPSPPAGTLDIYRHTLRICTGSFQRAPELHASKSTPGHQGFITAKQQSIELLGPSGGAAACKSRQRDG